MTHELKLQVGSPRQLRDHILRAAGHWTPGGSIRHTLDDLIAQIDAQLPKPAVEAEEIVRAQEAGFRDGVRLGQQDMNTRLRERIVYLRDHTPLIVEQRAYRKVVKAVEELAP